MCIYFVGARANFWYCLWYVCYMRITFTVLIPMSAMQLRITIIVYIGHMRIKNTVVLIKSYILCWQDQICLNLGFVAGLECITWEW